MSQWRSRGAPTAGIQSRGRVGGDGPVSPQDMHIIRTVRAEQAKRANYNHSNTTKTSATAPQARSHLLPLVTLKVSPQAPHPKALTSMNYPMLPGHYPITPYAIVFRDSKFCPNQTFSLHSDASPLVDNYFEGVREEAGDKVELGGERGLLNAFLEIVDGTYPLIISSPLDGEPSQMTFEASKSLHHSKSAKGYLDDIANMLLETFLLRVKQHDGEVHEEMVMELHGWFKQQRDNARIADVFKTVLGMETLSGDDIEASDEEAQEQKRHKSSSIQAGDSAPCPMLDPPPGGNAQGVCRANGGEGSKLGFPKLEWIKRDLLRFVVAVVQNRILNDEVKWDKTNAGSDTHVQNLMTHPSKAVSSFEQMITVLQCLRFHPFVEDEEKGDIYRPFVRFASQFLQILAPACVRPILRSDGFYPRGTSQGGNVAIKDLLGESRQADETKQLTLHGVDTSSIALEKRGTWFDDVFGRIETDVMYGKMNWFYAFERNGADSWPTFGFLHVDTFFDRESHQEMGLGAGEGQQEVGDVEQEEEEKRKLDSMKQRFPTACGFLNMELVFGTSERRNNGGVQD